MPTNPPPAEFNFSPGGAATPGGWRLRRLEMANWGTFGGGRVHVLSPETGWALLVGENGSGKSTVVDALRTLLVPRRLLRYAFNDAAGGQKRQDRSLVSYIRGAWSAARDEETADASTRHLRRDETLSYLLAVFHNLRQDATVTLAQILWVNGEGRDDAHFLLANREKTITADLQDAGAGREGIRRLRERGWTVCDPARYREEFCTRMGIPGDGALEIFNQAIGVKEVGDVNHFLRRHLLAPGEAGEVIRERVLPAFANLDDCWQKIETAGRQIEQLAPVVAAHARAQAADSGRADLLTLTRALPRHYTQRHGTLLVAHLLECEKALATTEAALRELETRTAEEQRRRDSLRQQLDGDATGRRIRELEVEIKDLNLRVRERQEKHRQLAALLAAQELGPVPESEAAFAALRVRVAEARETLEQQGAAARDRASQAGVEKLQMDGEIKRVQQDMQALANRRALIPARLQDLRDALCAGTGIVADELPFAGELMEVQPQYAQDWAGAIERLLHGFGLSMVVPPAHYGKVAAWVNGRRLVDRGGDGIRFDFLRAPAERSPARTPRSDESRTVVGRLNFREEHPLTSWIQAEVRRAFPHVCCRDVAEMDRVTHGLTAAGLVRFRFLDDALRAAHGFPVADLAAGPGFPGLDATRRHGRDHREPAQLSRPARVAGSRRHPRQRGRCRVAARRGLADPLPSGLLG